MKENKYKKTKDYSYDNSPSINITNYNDKNLKNKQAIKAKKKNIDYILYSQRNDIKEKKSLNNMSLFKLITGNECLDINQDLLNKQKQLKELEKQIKNTTKRPTINESNDNYISSNDISKISSHDISKNKIDELNFLIKEDNNSKVINNKNNIKDNNLINKYVNSNKENINYSNYNNYILYKKEIIEEDKNNKNLNLKTFTQNIKNNNPDNNYIMNDLKEVKKEKENENKKENNINYIEEKIFDENFKENNNNINNKDNNKDNNNSNNKDTELIYLRKITDLQKKINNQLIENKKLKEDKEKLSNDLIKIKKELNDKNNLYNKLKTEHTLLNKKYDILLKNQNAVIAGKEKQKQDEIEELKSKIDNLNVEIKAKEEKYNNDMSQLKQMLDNLKIIHEQLKDQYDLALLKMNTVNQENFTLKRELYFFQSNINNNINNSNNYNKNNNNSNYEQKEDSQKNINENKNDFDDDIQKKEENAEKKNCQEHQSHKKNNNLTINIDNSNDKEKKKNNELNKTNDNEEINKTITKSYRKFITSSNQNDSSGVSALLNNDITDNQTNTYIKETLSIVSNKDNFMKKDNNKIKNKYINNENKNKGIERNKSYEEKIKMIIYENNEENIIKRNKMNSINILTEENIIYNRKIKEIENNLINMQKQREIYIEQYNKIPEQPKTRNDLNEKRKLKKLIEELTTEINKLTNKEEKNK